MNINEIAWNYTVNNKKNDNNEWVYFDVTGIDKAVTIAEKSVLLSDIYLTINFQAVTEE